MLPGIRFLFGAIVLSMSILIFGLGATALLRTAHEEVASTPAWRATPEPRFAQSGEASTPVLALLRVDDAPKNEPPAAARVATAPAMAEPVSPPATEPAPAKAAELPQTTSSPVDPPKPDAALAERNLEVSSSATQNLPVQDAPIQNSPTGAAENPPQTQAAPEPARVAATPEPAKVVATEPEAPTPPAPQPSPPMQASTTADAPPTEPIASVKPSSPEQQASSTAQPLPTEQDTPAAQMPPSVVPSANQMALTVAPAATPSVPAQASEPDATDASNISTKIATLGGPPVSIKPDKPAKAASEKPEPKTRKKVVQKHAPARRRIVRARIARARIVPQAPPPQPLDPFGQPTVLRR